MSPSGAPGVGRSTPPAVSSPVRPRSARSRATDATRRTRPRTRSRRSERLARAARTTFGSCSVCERCLGVPALAVSRLRDFPVVEDFPYLGSSMLGRALLPRRTDGPLLGRWRLLGLLALSGLDPSLFHGLCGGRYRLPPSWWWYSSRYIASAPEAEALAVSVCHLHACLPARRSLLNWRLLLGRWRLLWRLAGALGDALLDLSHVLTLLSNPGYGCCGRHRLAGS